MFFPSYTYGGFDSFDAPFGSPFSTRNDILRAREIERRKQIQLQQRREMERRKRLQALQREERMERQLRERERQQREMEERHAFPPGTIIRGRDGRLYRVVAKPSNEQHIANHDDSFSDADSCSSKSMDSMEEENVAPSKETLNAMANEFTPKSFHNTNKASACFENNDIGNSQKKNTKTLTLVVEDVPLDEDEELRELRSVWRNRVPEPGQWIEPVESFERQ